MILSAGLSPAWQQIVKLDSLRPGEVNRAREVAWCASGKVVNVAVAAGHLGATTALISAIGGDTGDAVQREFARWNLPAEWIHTSVPTRVCTTLLAGAGPTTEIVENVAEMELEVLEDFVDRTRVYAANADVAVLTGSLPANAPDDLFARVLDGTDCQFVLDVRGDVLKACLPHRPLVIKPNRAELAATVGRDLSAPGTLLSAMRELVSCGAQHVIVSDGPRDVWVYSRDVTARLTPPRIAVVNPIGSGDCLAAGIAAQLLIDDDILAAVQFGIGAAAHNAERLLPARLDRERCEELAAEVVVELE